MCKKKITFLSINLYNHLLNFIEFALKIFSSPKLTSPEE